MAAAGFFDAPPEAAPEPAPASDTPAAPVIPEPVSASNGQPPEPAKPALDPADKRVAALMEREAALLTRETELKSFQADVEAFRTAQRQFKADPAGYIRSLAPDAKLRDVATNLWYEDLGDAAPPEHRTAQEARSAKLEVAQLRAELAERDKRQSEAQAQQAAQEAESRYVASLQQYAAAVPDSYGRVKLLATQKPEVATRLMHQAASMIAAREERIPTAEEAAKAVEEYLAELTIAPPATPAPAQPIAAPAASPPTSLRNSHSAAQTGRAPVDPNDSEVRRQRALEESGLAAFLYG